MNRERLAKLEAAFIAFRDAAIELEAPDVKVELYWTPIQAELYHEYAYAKDAIMGGSDEGRAVLRAVDCFGLHKNEFTTIPHFGFPSDLQIVVVESITLGKPPEEEIHGNAD